MSISYRRPALAGAALFILFASHLAAQPASNGRASVLIGFRQTPGPAEQAMVRGAGGTIRHSYTLVPAMAATLPEAALDGIRRNPLVTVVEPDGQFTAVAQTVPWGVSDIGALTVHASNTGNGIKVCILDSGIDTSHADLQPNAIAGYDYVNGDGVPDDENGHGTHVAGTIAGRDNDTGVLGVAPNVDLLVYKVLGASGSGSFSDVIAALQACASQYLGQLKITNNSYGSSTDPGTLVRAAFDNSYAQGVLHIAAAGNSGKPSGKGNTIGYPGRYSSVMAVAAVDSNHQRPYWSSYGDQAEISAPGVGIYSTLPPNTYGTYNGTSMASPHVAGVAALVAQACGFSQPAQIRQRLKDTALDLGTAGWDAFYGFGYVQAVAATTDCSAPPPPPPPSGFTLTATGYKIKGAKAADLAWSGAAGNVDIYRDGVYLAAQPSDEGSGTYTHTTTEKGGGSHAYQVCNASTTTCSNEVTVIY